MGRRERLSRGLLLAIALAGVYCLKRHASTATAEELRWLLTPTAALVEALGAGHFVWVAGDGYLDAEARFRIVPACAGVNFMAAILLTAGAGLAGTPASIRGRCAALLAAATAAWGVTVIVNALRITLAMALHQHPWWSPAFLAEAEAHQLLGILVYAGALSLLHAAVRWRWELPTWTTLAVPLGCYGVITLGLPALNGALSRPDFGRHVALVAAGATAILAFGTAIRTLAPLTHRSRHGASTHPPGPFPTSQ